MQHFAFSNEFINSLSIWMWFALLKTGMNSLPSDSEPYHVTSNVYAMCTLSCKSVKRSVTWSVAMKWLTASPDGVNKYRRQLIQTWILKKLFFHLLLPHTEQNALTIRKFSLCLVCFAVLSGKVKNFFQPCLISSWLKLCKNWYLKG